MLAQTVLNVIHGAADPVALFIALTEADGQRDFAELGAHAQQSGDPHPEDSAGAADGDGAGNAGDVASTDGSGQRGAHSLKGRNRAFLGLRLFKSLAEGVLHDVAEVGELGEPAADAHVDTSAKDQDHHGETPDDAVDLAVKIC